MAFENLFEFTEKIYSEIEKRNKLIEAFKDDPKQKQMRIKMRSQIEAYFNSLLFFHETVLKNPKFKTQREYCRRTLEELNPAFCLGYFKKLNHAKV